MQRLPQLPLGLQEQHPQYHTLLVFCQAADALSGFVADPSWAAAPAHSSSATGRSVQQLQLLCESISTLAAAPATASLTQELLHVLQLPLLLLQAAVTALQLPLKGEPQL